MSLIYFILIYNNIQKKNTGIYNIKHFAKEKKNKLLCLKWCHKFLSSYPYNKLTNNIPFLVIFIFTLL